jgi:hypothetical protein
MYMDENGRDFSERGEGLRLLRRIEHPAFVFDCCHSPSSVGGENALTDELPTRFDANRRNHSVSNGTFDLMVGWSTSWTGGAKTESLACYSNRTF